eukprot:gene6563-biopygen7399
MVDEGRSDHEALVWETKADADRARAGRCAARSKLRNRARTGRGQRRFSPVRGSVGAAAAAAPAVRRQGPLEPGRRRRTLQSPRDPRVCGFAGAGPSNRTRPEPFLPYGGLGPRSGTALERPDPDLSKGPHSGSLPGGIVWGLVRHRRSHGTTKNVGYVGIRGSILGRGGGRPPPPTPWRRADPPPTPLGGRDPFKKPRGKRRSGRPGRSGGGGPHPTPGRPDTPPPHHPGGGPPPLVRYLNTVPMARAHGRASARLWKDRESGLPKDVLATPGPPWAAVRGLWAAVRGLWAAVRGLWAFLRGEGGRQGGGGGGSPPPPRRTRSTPPDPTRPGIP